MSKDAVLEIISNETLDAVHEIDVVTPSIYSSMFSKYASAHDTDVANETKLTDTLLDQKITMCQSMQQETSEGVIKLSDNTSKAILAIRDKDENRLNDVLKETQSLKSEIEKLKEAVYKDELTGVYNRKWLNDNYIKTGSENFKTAGVMTLIDLNYFKIINDTHGHIIGDKVLVFVANQLRKTKKKVIRYGGDEFIVIFSKNTSKETALKSLDSIREGIVTKMLKAGEKKFRVSFSFGAKAFSDGDSLGDTIELADKDMYEDKIQIKKRITGIK